MGKQTIESLVGQLELWINQPGSTPTEIVKSGLTIHYSESVKKWVVGYGRGVSGRKAVKRPEHFGLGDTIVEALEDKIKKVN